MPDYYLNGEERFGPVTSYLYYFAGKLPLCKKMYDYVVDDVRRSRASVILDIGTGPGDVPLRLAADGRRRIFAIDPSKSMIKIASRHSGGMKNLKFALGSSRHIPFNVKFDMIYTSASYHHWIDKKASLRYINSFLRRNGEIRIYEYNARKLHGFVKLGRSHALNADKVFEDIQGTGLQIKNINEREQYLRVILVKRGAGRAI